MPEVEIYPATSQDFGGLASLDRSYQTTRVWQLDNVRKEGEMQTFLREIRLPRPAPILYPYNGEELKNRAIGYDEVLVAKILGAQVGYVSLKKIQPINTAWVSELVIDLPERNQKAGTALLLAAQDWAAQVGLRKVCIEMQSKNYPGICLARKLGFEFVGFHDQYYPNQDIALFFVIRV